MKKLNCFYLLNLSAVFFISIFIISCGNNKLSTDSSHTDKAKKPIIPKTVSTTTSYAGNNIFERTHITPLHQQGYYGKDVIVGIFDDGINFNDPLLEGKFILGGDSNSYSKSGGHGQSMAIILSGKLNENQQMGVAPYSKIVSKIGINDTQILESAQRGASIVSISQFGFDLKIIDTQAVKDTMIVVIAGNNNKPNQATMLESGNTAPFDTKFGNIIVTVAVDLENKLTKDSRKCGHTQNFCIAVPSDNPTSPTAPVVAGVLALLKQAYPNLEAKEYIQALLTTATPLDDSSKTGVGLIDAYKAFQKLAKTHLPKKGNHIAPKFSNYYPKIASNPPLKHEISYVASGESHFCALIDGNIKCWGNNVFGQLGNLDIFESTKPISIPGLPGRVKFISKDASIAIIENTGEVYKWGLEGIKKIENIPMPAIYVDSFFNGYHMCVIVESGDLYCKYKKSMSLTKVTGLNQLVKSVSVGVNFTCALLEDGSVWSWGDNFYGQLGIGDTNIQQSLVPLQVVGLDNPIKQIVVNKGPFVSACALDILGKVKCWGRNGLNMLGVENQNGLYESFHPVEISGIQEPIKSLYYNSRSYYAITESDQLVGWGEIQKKPGEFKKSLPTYLLPNQKISHFSIDSNYSMCAMIKDQLGISELKCWGDNSFGQLGNGNKNNSEKPTSLIDLFF